MKKEGLKNRTKVFALQILKLADGLPNSVSGRTLANQIARSGTSVAANYRAACRAKSKADFISKMGTVEEEADETLFWLELIEESGLLPSERLTDLKREADELTAIAVSSIKTSRNNNSTIKNPKSEMRT